MKPSGRKLDSTLLQQDCKRRAPARQPMRARKTAANSSTGEGSEKTEEVSTGSTRKSTRAQAKAARGGRRELGQGHHAAAETRAQTRASGVGHSRAHVQCVCVCVCIRPRSVAQQYPPGKWAYKSLDGTAVWLYRCSVLFYIFATPRSLHDHRKTNFPDSRPLSRPLCGDITNGLPLTSQPRSPSFAHLCEPSPIAATITAASI